MSNYHLLAENFLKKKKSQEESHSPSTLVVNNSFRSLFSAEEMDKNEVSQIKELLKQHLIEGDLDKDFQYLLQITTELKAIQKQAILLVGERVHKAREIFRGYEESKKLFTSWLKLTFNSTKTAYNALNFYALYEALSTQDLRLTLKKMPAKTTYILASKEGTLEEKELIIANYSGQKHEEMLELIQKRFPPKEADKRSNYYEYDEKFVRLKKMLIQLRKISDKLSHQEKSELKKELSSFCESL